MAQIAITVHVDDAQLPAALSAFASLAIPAPEVTAPAVTAPEPDEVVDPEPVTVTTVPHFGTTINDPAALLQAAPPQAVSVDVPVPSAPEPPVWDAQSSPVKP